MNEQKTTNNQERGPKTKMTNEQFGRPEKEFEERVIEINRISRTVAGGRRMRFRALVAIGNKNGRVGIGIAKGKDVSMAVAKAIKIARRKMINLPLKDGMITNSFSAKFCATSIILKPGKPGSAIVAGGSLRDILEVAGAKSIVAKIIGSTNKVNVARATLALFEEIK